VEGFGGRRGWRFHHFEVLQGQLRAFVLCCGQKRKNRRRPNGEGVIHFSFMAFDPEATMATWEELAASGPTLTIGGLMRGTQHQINLFGWHCPRTTAPVPRTRGRRRRRKPPNHTALTPQRPNRRVKSLGTILGFAARDLEDVVKILSTKDAGLLLRDVALSAPMLDGLTRECWLLGFVSALITELLARGPSSTLREAASSAYKEVRARPRWARGVSPLFARRFVPPTHNTTHFLQRRPSHRTTASPFACACRRRCSSSRPAPLSS
jgi:hypothetical protein